MLKLIIPPEPQNLLSRNTIYEYNILPLCPHNAVKCIIACKIGPFTWMAFLYDVISVPVYCSDGKVYRLIIARTIN